MHNVKLSQCDRVKRVLPLIRDRLTRSLKRLEQMRCWNAKGSNVCVIDILISNLESWLLDGEHGIYGPASLPILKT